MLNLYIEFEVEIEIIVLGTFEKLAVWFTIVHSRSNIRACLAKLLIGYGVGTVPSGAIIFLNRGNPC